MNTEIKREWFHNQRSFEAFLYAATIARTLEKARLRGYMIFDGDSLMTDGQRVVEFSGDDDDQEPVVGYRQGNCLSGYAGFTHDCTSGKTWLTKKEVKDVFKGVKICPPQYCVSALKVVL